MNRLIQLHDVPYRLCLTLENGNILHKACEYETDRQLKCYPDCKLCHGVGLISGKMFHAIRLAEESNDVHCEINNYKKVYCCHCFKAFNPQKTTFKRNKSFSPVCPYCGLATLIIETEHGKITKSILRCLSEVLLLVRTSTKTNQ